MNELDEILHTITERRVTRLRGQRVRLKVTAGPDKGAECDVENVARVGARPLADLVLHDPKVSGVHCEIIAGPTVRVRDLRSKNGTFVGDLRIHDIEIPQGESIRVGDSHVTIVSQATFDIPLAEENQLHGLVGCSGAMRALMARVEQIAPSNATVLIRGETGVGKELVAEALHFGSPRASGPFVIVDCGSLPAGLIESELFGHERGAFTGADTTVRGAFERADGGTLFLDEIGELSMGQQPKLLRALESRRVQRIGASRDIKIDVRVVAATHRDLQLEVGKGNFREDLYHRLAVVPLLVPSLRDRPEDLPLLATHLLRQMNVEPADYLTRDSLDVMARHDWPGNVRELRNALERAVVLRRGVEVDPPLRAVQAGGVDLSIPIRLGREQLVANYEREYLSALLRECDGNIALTARRAGVDRISIYRLMQRLGMNRSEE